MPNWLAWSSSIFTILAGVPAIGYVIKDYMAAADAAKGELAVNAVVSIEIVLLLCWMFYREIKTARKYKYHKTTEDIHECIHSLRDLSTYLGEQLSLARTTPLTSEKKEDVSRVFRSQLSYVLDKLLNAYSHIATGHCRVAIKVIEERDGAFFAYTLIRDTHSLRTCQVDDERRYRDGRDPLEDNDDFKMIFSDEDRYFFSNDLKKLYHYNSTSFATYGQYKKGERWPLPYRSTFVWPIRQGAAPNLVITTKRCIGFLAVDSTRANAFSESVDFHLGAAVADALFHPLMLCNKLLTGNGEPHVDIR